MNNDEMRKKYAEEIRRKFSQESSQGGAQEFVQRQLESAKKTAVLRYLTKEARERLANVRVAKPELAETVEMALVEALQSGMLNGQIDDEKLKLVLEQVSSQKRFNFIK